MVFDSFLPNEQFIVSWEVVCLLQVDVVFQRQRLQLFCDVTEAPRRILRAEGPVKSDVTLRSDDSVDGVRPVREEEAAGFQDFAATSKQTLKLEKKSFSQAQMIFSV